MSSWRKGSAGAGHVVDEVADFLEARLDAAKEAAVRSHLSRCSECAADYAWAQAFRDEALRQGLRHPSPERLVFLADQAEPALTPAERTHLTACPSCRREFDWSRNTPLPPDGQPVPEAPSTICATPSHPPRRVLPAHPRPSRIERLSRPVALKGLVLAAAAAIALLILVPRDGAEVKALATIEPLPVHVTRGPVPSDPFDESRIEGLGLYASGDFRAAAERLGQAAALRPHDPEVLLYLGSAKLLLRAVSEARRTLEEAAARASIPLVKEEALWQLANAHLSAGKGKEAAEVLREVDALDGTRAAGARKILEGLAARGIRAQ